jgi:hypothetical protein
MKIVSMEGFDIPVHVVDDLSDEELVEYFRIAFEKGDYEHCAALHAEATRRNIKLKI